MQRSIKQSKHKKISIVLLVIVLVFVIVIIRKNNQIQQLKYKNEFLQTRLNNVEIRFDSLVENYLQVFMQEHCFQYQEQTQ